MGMFQRPHLPTLGTTLVLILIAFVLYHFIFVRRR